MIWDRLGSIPGAARFFFAERYPAKLLKWQLPAACFLHPGNFLEGSEDRLFCPVFHKAEDTEADGTEADGTAADSLYSDISTDDEISFNLKMAGGIGITSEVGSVSPQYMLKVLVMQIYRV